MKLYVTVTIECTLSGGKIPKDELTSLAAESVDSVLNDVLEGEMLDRLVEAIETDNEVEFTIQEITAS